MNFLEWGFPPDKKGLGWSINVIKRTWVANPITRKAKLKLAPTTIFLPEAREIICGKLLIEKRLFVSST